MINDLGELVEIPGIGNVGRLVRISPRVERALKDLDIKDFSVVGDGPVGRTSANDGLRLLRYFGCSMLSPEQYVYTCKLLKDNKRKPEYQELYRDMLKNYTSGEITGIIREGNLVEAFIVLDGEILGKQNPDFCPSHGHDHSSSIGIRPYKPYPELYQLEFVHIPEVKSVAIEELKLDSKVEKAIIELGYELESFGKHDDGTLVLVSGDEALSILEKLGSTMLTEEQYTATYSYAKRLAPYNKQLRRLLNKMNHFQTATAAEMVKRGDTIVLVNKGEIFEHSRWNEEKYDPKGLCEIVGVREVRA